MYQVVGIQNCDFKAQDGSEIRGRNLFLTFEDDHVEGLRTDKIFLSDKRFGHLSLGLGDEIEIRWNRWGKVDSIDTVK